MSEKIKISFDDIQKQVANDEIAKDETKDFLVCPRCLAASPEEKHSIYTCKSCHYEWLPPINSLGYDNIDVLAARELGIGVCNVPAYSTNSVVLFTVATVLALTSRLLEYNNFVRSGEYSESGVPNKLSPVYHDLSGKTWGIIGYGNIGRAVGCVAEAFGAKVIVNKRTPVDGVEIVDIERLCRESDIITIHCPLNDQSRGIIDKDKVALMKSSVVLVNEARGAVLDEEAVAAAVIEGRIGCFGCDVYSKEPFDVSHPYNRIKDLPNVILTPHAALRRRKVSSANCRA